MGVKVSNNAYGTLATAISAAATTITLEGGDGAKFPALGAGDYFYATLIDTANNLEIVKVTSRAIDSLIVERGMDGTVARSYALGDRLELRPVAALYNEKADKAYVDSEILALDGEKLDYVVPGISGNVMTSNGSGWVSAPLSTSGRLLGVNVYLSSAVYNKTVRNPSFVVVEVVGGGGPGRNAGSTGSNGGTSSFGSHCSATGGTSGSTSSAAAGVGGTGVNADLSVTGSPGEPGSTSPASGGYSKFGASVGRGGRGGSYSVGKTSASTGGGGGGGYGLKLIPASSLGTSESVTVGLGGTTNSGNNGSAGIVLVWEYS